MITVLVFVAEPLDGGVPLRLGRIENTLEALQGVVQGDIECVRGQIPGARFEAFVAERARSQPLYQPPLDIYIMGNVLYTGPADVEGNTTSLGWCALHSIRTAYEMEI